MKCPWWVPEACSRATGSSGSTRKTCSIAFASRSRTAASSPRLEIFRMPSPTRNVWSRSLPRSVASPSSPNSSAAIPATSSAVKRGGGASSTLASVTSARLAEPDRDQFVGRGRAGAASRHGGDERVPVEPIQVDVGAARHGGGARHVAQERDLAEVIARLQAARRLVVDGDVELTSPDHVEAVSDIAGADDRLPAVAGDPHQAQGQPPA